MKPEGFPGQLPSPQGAGVGQAAERLALDIITFNLVPICVPLTLNLTMRILYFLLGNNYYKQPFYATLCLDVTLLTSS